jgi:hypothetical protein
MYAELTGVGYMFCLRMMYGPVHLYIIPGCRKCIFHDMTGVWQENGPGHFYLPYSSLRTLLRELIPTELEVVVTQTKLRVR